MTTQRVDSDVHEANGFCSALDIEIFRAYKKVLHHIWTRAEVSSRRGLYLFDERTVRHPFCLHFSSSICGHVGDGPRAAATILHEAGFCSFEYLKDEVFNHEYAQFTK